MVLPAVGLVPYEINVHISTLSVEVIEGPGVGLFRKGGTFGRVSGLESLDGKVRADAPLEENFPQGKAPEDPAFAEAVFSPRAGIVGTPKLPYPGDSLKANCFSAAEDPPG